MAEMRGLFQSDFEDEPIILRNPNDDPEAIRHSGFFAYHDIHALSMVVGISKGDRMGGDIYEISGVSADPFEAFSSMRGFLKPENITGSILPFGHSKEIPIHTDEGEPGQLTIIHLPFIQVTKIIEVTE